jgi:hypothetical protein
MLYGGFLTADRILIVYRCGIERPLHHVSFACSKNPNKSPPLSRPGRAGVNDEMVTRVDRSCAFQGEPQSIPHPSSARGSTGEGQIEEFGVPTVAKDEESRGKRIGSKTRRQRLLTGRHSNRAQLRRLGGTVVQKTGRTGARLQKSTIDWHRATIT